MRQLLTSRRKHTKLGVSKWMDWMDLDWIVNGW
jgi:hypothetical protein